MSKRKSTGERIEEINKKLDQMAALKKQLVARQKEEERKARAHRLILIGAEVERILGRPIEEKDLPKLVKFLNDQEYRGRYFSKAMQEKEESDTAEEEYR